MIETLLIETVPARAIQYREVSERSIRVSKSPDAVAPALVSEFVLMAMMLRKK